MCSSCYIYSRFPVFDEYKELLQCIIFIAHSFLNNYVPLRQPAVAGKRGASGCLVSRAVPDAATPPRLLIATAFEVQLSARAV